MLVSFQMKILEMSEHMKYNVLAYSEVKNPQVWKMNKISSIAAVKCILHISESIVIKFYNM